MSLDISENVVMSALVLDIFHWEQKLKEYQNSSLDSEDLINEVLHKKTISLALLKLLQRNSDV